MIKRNLKEASDKKFDVIIIGGGIYGACLLLTAQQAGKNALLLEKDDFGAATSFNNLRTVHGGLRYLQSMDIKRIFESVSERRWFFRNFPDLVEPLPCLMPLYGNGVYRPSIFRYALWLNDLFSFNRNSGVAEERKLSNGKIISSYEVSKLFPQVDKKNLLGGAVWYDGAMPDSQKILIEIIKWACWKNGTALNYTEAEDLLVKGGKVFGVKAKDKTNDQIYEFNSSKVINASGPWSRKFAAKFDKDYPELFRDSIAWNVLFNKPAISKFALAVKPKKPNARIYFMHHWKGMLFAGTVHSAFNGTQRTPIPNGDEVNNFIDDLNFTIKDLKLKITDVLQIFSGLLPARIDGSEKLAVREVIIDHGENEGPKGAYSISGVKFTTARLVAEKTIKQLFHLGSQNINPDGRIPVNESELGIFKTDWTPNDKEDWKTNLSKIIKDESAVHLDDLLIRRTTLGDNPATAIKYAKSYCELFGWDNTKTEEEILRLKSFYNSRSIINFY